MWRRIKPEGNKLDHHHIVWRQNSGTEVKKEEKKVDRTFMLQF